MPKYQLLLPEMGESVEEAVIVNWLKEVGEEIDLRESIVEVATDKVDSDIPSPVCGKITHILVPNNEIAKVGAPIAIVETHDFFKDPMLISTDSEINKNTKSLSTTVSEEKVVANKIIKQKIEVTPESNFKNNSKSNFLSPLVKKIITEECITPKELSTINGSGLEGRITKDDINNYLLNRVPINNLSVNNIRDPEKIQAKTPSIENVQVIEMDRTRKLIADHMVKSVKTAPHVTSFIDADTTNLFQWRNKIKDNFYKNEGEKITFTPIFIQIVAKALRQFPMMNISVDGDKIIQKNNINIGMATALSNGNLIVPVIKDADRLSLRGLVSKVNDLAFRAKNNNLNPDEVMGGTYTISNIGTFGNLMGTPIINQPQVGILAFGKIQKVPAVVETPQGDFITVRNRMYLSHAFDHRVVDGALGGAFVKFVADQIENFDLNTIV